MIAEKRKLFFSFLTTDLDDSCLVLPRILTYRGIGCYISCVRTAAYKSVSLAMY